MHIHMRVLLYVDTYANIHRSVCTYIHTCIWRPGLMKDNLGTELLKFCARVGKLSG